MIFSKIKPYLTILCVLAFVALLTHRHTLQQKLQQLQSDQRQAAIALQQALVDAERLRTQYLQIQQVVDEVAGQKQRLEKHSATLQQALLQSQRHTPCLTEPVPDTVTQQLRQRIVEVNALVDSN